MTLVAAREAIKTAIQAGLQSGENDSLVHEYLAIRVTRKRKELENHTRYRYRLRRAPERFVGLITGSIEHVRDVDVWVNSENTDMQMARSYDGSMSGLIRYLGAKRNTLGEVVDDKIANALQEELRRNNMRSVTPTHVVETTSGELAATHNVKLLLHAATVLGAPGQGYCPVPGFARCVTNALNLASAAGHESIVFPIFSAGTARGDVAESFGKMLTKAICYLEGSTAGTIKNVYFLAYSEDELWACRDVLDRRSSDVEEVP
jgi:O-acetyl-ADP-ribose deacetylase (regulator of RNase III)